MRNTFILLSLLFSSSLINAQTNLKNLLQDPKYDIETIDISLPIHKSTAYKSMIWGSDYGDGNIYRSTDNGDSFEKMNQLKAEYFESIQFLDSKNGFICGDYGYVYKTIDGGETWVEISPEIDGRIKERYRNDSTKNQTPNGSFVAYYTMHFLSTSNGYVSGFSYNPNTGFRESFERIFYVTNDGGHNWKKLDATEKVGIIEQFKQSSTQENITIEGEYFYEDGISWKLSKGKNKSDVIVKTDYKKNTSDTLALAKTPFKRSMLRSIVFINPSIGFILGGSLDTGNTKAVIYYTSNSGDSWEYLDTELDHIHSAISNKGYLFLFGKNGLMKKVRIKDLIKL